MNLVIDQGNTQCKLALFENTDEPEAVFSTGVLTNSFLQTIKDQFKPARAIYSSVAGEDPDILSWLRESFDYFIPLKPTTPVPIRIEYGTADSLGVDRIAAAVGAVSIKPGHPLLVVDMGTAITYDMVDRQGVFKGGNIAPGLQLRFQALHQYTRRLPLVSPDERFLPLGTDTEKAIRSGVMQGILYELEGYLRDYREEYTDLFAFLTGGDSHYFAKRVKSGIFVCENLVLIGLNHILEHHV
jgi:type III pantothenate kinase